MNVSCVNTVERRLLYADMSTNRVSLGVQQARIFLEWSFHTRIKHESGVTAQTDEVLESRAPLQDVVFRCNYLKRIKTNQSDFVF